MYKNVVTYNSVADTQCFACHSKCKVCNSPANNAVEIALCKYLLHQHNGNTKVVGLDLGAHSGVYGMALSNQLTEMYSFEVDPSIFNTLLKNSINHTLIKPFNLAVWDKDEQNPVEIKSNEGIVCNFQAIALDNFSQLPPVATIGFIKIDIEGAETHALRGMRSILEQCGNVVMEIEYCKKHFEAFGVDEREYFDILEQTGFKFSGPMSMSSVQSAGKETVLNLFYVK